MSSAIRPRARSIARREFGEENPSRYTKAGCPRIGDALDTDIVRARTEEKFNELADSIRDDTPGWVATIPGKSLLRMFTSAANLNLSRAKNLYPTASRYANVSPFADILVIFEGFADEEA